MKRLLSMLFLVVVMAFAMFSCSRGGTSQTPAPSTAAESKEIVEIIWQYPSPGDLGVGFQEMEDALNVMMERDIGVHVRFEPVGLIESQQKAALMVSSGEQLDISLTFLGTLGPSVENGMILPLDDLIEQYGPDIKAQCGEQFGAYSYKGSIYGVPPPGAIGNAYGYIARKDILEKYGISVDENKKYTLADVEAVFEKVKAGEGPNFYCTIPWNTEPAPLNNSYIEYDGSLACGVLMLNRSFTDLTITNLFETEEYKNYAQMMYRWAQKGYISPDAAVTSEFSDTLMKSGNYLGEFYWHNPKNTYEISASLGMSMSSMKLLDGYALNTSNAGVSWNIPVTSINPAKAVQALNYILQYKKAAWLIQYGLEGKSYEIVEETPDGAVIKYLADDPSTLPYFNPYGLWGNLLEQPAVYPTPANINKLRKEFDDAIPKSRYSPVIGYSFVQESVATEIAAVNTVIAQYTPGFNSGSLNPDTALSEFIAALKAAGIDKIIAENQRQLNEWAVAKNQ